MTFRRNVERVLMSGLVAVGMGTGVPEATDRAEKAVEVAERKPLQIEERDFAAYIQDKKIFIGGEDHGEEGDGRIFVRLLPVLKKAGFTHVGIELDHDLRQSFIDRYYKTRDQEAREWIESVQNGADLLRIIDEARALGMEVLCIDERKEVPGGEKMSEVERREKKWDQRDAGMFERVEQVMSDPSHKMAIYIGSAHGVARKEVYFQNGIDEMGMPVMRSIRQPLAYRLTERYGEDDVGIVDLGGCEDSLLSVCM